MGSIVASHERAWWGLQRINWSFAEFVELF
jgi:hypothetical protein